MKKQINVDGKTIIVTNEATQNFEGSIIITDPCYFISDDIWEVLCNDVWFDEKKSTPFANVGTIYIGSVKILYSSTAHGDGEYTVKGCSGIIQNKFGVDAGVMAIITTADLEKISNKDHETSGFAFIEEFDGVITANGKGNFLGDLEVITDDFNQSGWIDEDSDSNWDDDDDRLVEKDNKTELDDWDDEDEDDSDY